MDKTNYSRYSLPQLHQAIIHAKDDKELIKILHNYVASVGGLGNAPVEVYERFRH